MDASTALADCGLGVKYLADALCEVCLEESPRGVCAPDACPWVKEVLGSGVRLSIDFFPGVVKAVILPLQKFWKLYLDRKTTKVYQQSAHRFMINVHISCQHES